MHVRRRVLTAGAVLAAAAGVVLLATPAQAGDQWQADHWQVGMQLGPAPVGLTGAGGLPAVLLGALPVSSVAVEDARGQTVLRLNASSRLPEAPRPAFAGNLEGDAGPGTPEQVPDGLDPARPAVREVREVADAGRAPATAVDRVAGQVAPALNRVAAEPVAVPVDVPLQVPGADSVLGGRYAWVPIEGFAGLGPDAGGLPWTGGLALAVLIGGAGAVTVVARQCRTSPE